MGWREKWSCCFHGYVNDTLCTDLSLADIVDYCYKIGIVTYHASATDSLGRNVEGALPFAAVPTMSPTCVRA